MLLSLPHTQELIQLALDEDLQTQGDITSKATIHTNVVISAFIQAKAQGVLAGLRVVEAVYQAIDPSVRVDFYYQDGNHVEAGAAVCRVTGSAQSILTGERTALNFLQRLSGIATLTSQFVAAVAGTKTCILDTRKTTPGWRALEKYAVGMGGGQNHRMGLYDMVMIKDNHIDASGSITAAVKAVRNYPNAAHLQIEVEVKNLDELHEVLPLNVDRVLLDNMTTAQITEAVQLAAGRVPLEASGNMTLERVSEVARTGVDYISVGALTHSAPVLDLSMRITRS